MHLECEQDLHHKSQYWLCGIAKAPMKASEQRHTGVTGHTGAECPVYLM
jgi:hypothetical protein